MTAGDSPLEAELYAPTRASGFIHEGQDVRLMYQAFPHEKFGTGEGVVTSVSRTVLAPAEVAIPGLQVSEPVFRIRVRMKSDTVAAYGRRVPLQPGMLLNADVVIDRRSLLEWLLDPLYAAGRRT
jgi:membrane fusion protein